MITRRAALAAPFLAPASRAAASRPNVVVFMTDDHGAWANGCYGCLEVQTPNIDALARGGARFTRAFAATPVCSPSRMTYMTGKLPAHHTVQDWLRPADSFGPRSRRWLDGHTTWTQILAQHGYHLGMSGKWHMGQDDKAQAGFSYWATVPGAGGPYRDPEFVKNGERLRYKGFKTDAVGGFALEYLSQRKTGEPFVLFVPFYAPHTPFDYQPAVYRAPYQDAAFTCFPSTPRHPWQRQADWLSALYGNKDAMRAYCSLITGLDANVGRIVRFLEERKLRENTLIVFTADQGWNAGHHGFWGKGNGTWPFNMYEESIRVPMIWNHPRGIRAGQTPDAMVGSYDFFPTILDYLGIPAPADKQRCGRSYAPLLRGRTPRWENRLYFEYSYVRALRTENLKYIERAEGFPSELYDLEADPGETRNVLEDAKYKAQAAVLRSELRGYFEKLGAAPIARWRDNVRQELSVYGSFPGR